MTTNTHVTSIKVTWFILLTLHASSPARPPKIDLGLIIDSSTSMTNRTFQSALQIVKSFANQLSISPGTTRVALYTISSEAKEHFPFGKHVNRKCLLKALQNIPFSNKTRSNTFHKLLERAVDLLERRSNQVVGQRRLYIFITNSKSQIPKVNKKINPPRWKDLVTIIVGTNITKELNKRKERAKFFIYYDKKDFTEILHKLKLEPKSYSLCTGNETVVDECHRSCVCVDGKLTDCSRIRREFTSMSREERRRYLKVYKTLTSQSPYKESYERYIFMHFKYFCYGVHDTELFLPWHRWFISVMEDLLRQIDCRITLPYWDWSVVSKDPWNRTDIWSDRDDGLGGNGDRSKGYCVQTGIFRESQWETPYWEDPLQIIITTVDQHNKDIDRQNAHLAYCLRRNLHRRPPGVESVRRALSIPPRRFGDFNLHMLHNYHNALHNMIGGTMATDYAANAPEFFLHHSFLDKIWYMWQSRSRDHKYVHFLQRNVTNMMGCEHTQRELIDSHNLPRCIKVKYSKFPVNKREKRLKDDIDDMARSPDAFWKPYLLKKWDNVFPSCKSTMPQKKRAHYLHLMLDVP